MEQRIYADNLSEQPLLTLHKASPLDREAPTRAPWVYLVVKRVFDIAASLLLLGIFFLPLMIVALCIRWESPGSAIHRRRVLARQRWDGAQGEDALRTFDAYKLRTMITDADEYLKRHPHLLESTRRTGSSRTTPGSRGWGRSCAPPALTRSRSSSTSSRAR